MTSTPKERALDTSLLSGALDVDSYAAELLKTHSLEHALKEIDSLKRENEALRLKKRSLAHVASESSESDSQKRKPEWYEEMFKDELANLDYVQTKLMDDKMKAQTLELESVKVQRDELVLAQSEFDVRWRAMEELNKTHLAKNHFLERRLDEEIDRGERYYAALCKLLENNYMRKWIRRWTEATCARDRKLELKASKFRRVVLIKEALHVLAGNVEEERMVRLAKAKVSRSLLVASLRAWAVRAKEMGRLDRVATSFLKGRETLRLRSAFSDWKEFCRSKKNAAAAASKKFAAVSTVTTIQPTTPLSSEMSLNDLREVAAIEKVPAIMYAASRGFKSLVLQLIAEGSAVNMKARGTGASPLHAAAEAGFTGVVEILLEAGANPSVTDDSGETPLHRSVRAGKDLCVDVALALLRHGANATSVTERDGKCVLLLAAEARSSPRLIAVLLQYRARLDQQQANTGRTALHASAAKCDLHVIKTMLEYAGKDLSANEPRIGKSFPRDANKQTPLHLACSSDSPDSATTITMLIEADFDVNTPSSSGESPLHVFCQNPNAKPEALDAFSATAKFDSVDFNGNTPLHFACSAHSNNRGLALRLVEFGAPLYVLNANGQSPLDLVPQGFAIRLLNAVRTPPFLHRAKRAHRNLLHCMICKEPVDVGFLKRRVADHCRRCGRLCCARCASSRAVLLWPDFDPLMRNIGAMTGGIENGEDVIVDTTNAVKVCEHCAEILKGDVELTISEGTSAA